MRERIRDCLAQRLEAPDLQLDEFVRHAVGWSHETFTFVARSRARELARPLCLRLDPGHTLLRHISRLDEQARVLAALEKTAVPAPRLEFHEPDPALLGGPFLVMERVEGTCPSPWSDEGKRFYAEAAARGGLPRDFTRVLAELHTLDWRAAGFDFLGAPEPGTGFALAELARWQSLVDAAECEPEPVLVDLGHWLRENAPPCERAVLVHGAYRTGNLLIADDRVSALLDWEFPALGDPLYDVAYVLSDLNREGSPLLSCLVEREAFLRDYRAQTGVEVDLEVCEYYLRLYEFRTAAFWLSASGLYRSGKSADLRLARTAYSVPAVLDRAARALGY